MTKLGVVKSSALKSRAAPKDTTASVQDYLAAIYDLQSSGKPVIGARLVKHMGISAPAVTEAIHRVSRAGYVRVDRKSTRLNSSHTVISYAVFCLKKKKKERTTTITPSTTA